MVRPINDLDIWRCYCYTL